MFETLRNSLITKLFRRNANRGTEKPVELHTERFFNYTRITTVISFPKKNIVFFTINNIFNLISIVEDKQKFDALPYVCDQPSASRDIFASLVEDNSRLVAREREWEMEWNQSGMMSRLTEEVCLSSNKTSKDL